MATTWAGTASNQAVTRAALQDAFDTGALNRLYFFTPSTDSNLCVNKFDACTKYANINTPSGVSNNELIMKSEFVVATGYPNSLSIGGRRDGANVDIWITYSAAGGSSIVTLDSTTCKLYGVIGYPGTGTCTIEVKNSSNQNIKFWMVETGTSCPTGGTQYNNIVYTPTTCRNMLITPVWSGGSYVLV